jgi:hypothetical protein
LRVPAPQFYCGTDRLMFVDNGNGVRGLNPCCGGQLGCDSPTGRM